MKKGRLFYYLDDERPNPDPNLWVLFKTAPDLIWAITNLLHISPDLSNLTLSLDHDLGVRNDGGYTDGTGYDVTCFLEEISINLPGFVMPTVRIHSSNPVGRAKMQACLDSIKRRMNMPD